MSIRSNQGEAAIELISKLEPHACAMTERVDGGWIPDLLPEDIAAALGTIKGDSPASLLLRAKYGNEAGAGRLLLARLRGSAMLSYGIALGDAKRLAELVWKAAILPPICHTCGGRKEVMTEALRIVCHSCSGTGVGRQSDGELAGAMGVSVRAWRQEWEGRFSVMVTTAATWERDGIEAVKKYLC